MREANDAITLSRHIKTFKLDKNCCVPPPRIERGTFRLRSECSTTKLKGHFWTLMSTFDINLVEFTPKYSKWLRRLPQDSNLRENFPMHFECITLTTRSDSRPGSIHGQDWGIRMKIGYTLEINKCMGSSSTMGMDEETKIRGNYGMSVEGK